MISLKTNIQDLRLDIVGNGPYFKVCQKIINDNNAGDYIKLHGEISDEKLATSMERVTCFLAHTMLDNGDTEDVQRYFLRQWQTICQLLEVAVREQYSYHR